MGKEKGRKEQINEKKKVEGKEGKLREKKREEKK